MGPRVLVVLVSMALAASAGIVRGAGPQSAPAPPTFRPGVPLADHAHRRFDLDDGLPSRWIQDLIQSRDGYVWVATRNGLARFDGRRFALFSTRDEPGLPGNHLRRLLETGDGTLWVGGQGGLARRAPGRGQRFEGVSELDGRLVTALHEDDRGRVWVGTEDGLWRAAGGGPFVRIPEGPTHVRAILDDTAGALWVGSRWGLFSCDPTGAGFRREAAELLPGTPRPDWVDHDSQVNALLRDGHGVLAATRQGLLRLEGGQVERLIHRPAFQVSALLRASDGRVVAGDGRWLSWSTEEGFASAGVQENVQALLEDREGGLWVGHVGHGGLERYHADPVETLIPERFALCVREDEDGLLWVGTHEGLLRRDGDAWTRFGIDEGLRAGTVRTVAPARGGGLWVGGSGGLARLEDDHLTAVDEPPELAGMAVRAVHEDRSGALWIARWGEGAYRLRDGRLEPVEGLDGGRTMWFHEDMEGRVWMGHERGVFRAEHPSDAGSPPRVTRVRDPALDGRPAAAPGHHVTPDGDLWIATEGGLVRHRASRIDVFTVREGLAAESLERLGSDAHGNLWLGGWNGLYTVPLAELDAVADGLAGSVTSRIVSGDGGLGRLSMGHGTPNTWRGRDGTLYVAAFRGVLAEPPDPPMVNGVPPQAHVESVRLDDEPLGLADRLAFTSGRNRLAVHFTAVSFSRPEQVRVWYRLDGRDTDWVEAGDDRTAQYTDLGPGDYTFRLVAENEDGVRAAREETLAFTVEPRWFERTELRLLGLIVLLGLAALVMRLRIRRALGQQAVLLREVHERERAEEEARRHWEQLGRVSRAASMGELTTAIAHEVKQPLCAIVSNAQAATHLLDGERPDRAEALAALEDIARDSHRASEIIDHIRSLVRKEPGPMTEVDLVEVVADALRLAEPEVRRRGVRVHTRLDEGLRPVRGDPVELEQVVLNLLINGVQSMEDTAGRQLTVSAISRDGSVFVEVSDEGVGFDDEQASRLFEPFYTTKAGGTGMGLAMNRAIIVRHGGEIWARPNPGPGATFGFRLDALAPTAAPTGAPANANGSASANGSAGANGSASPDGAAT